MAHYDTLSPAPRAPSSPKEKRVAGAPSHVLVSEAPGWYLIMDLDESGDQTCLNSSRLPGRPRRIHLQRPETYPDKPTIFQLSAFHHYEVMCKAKRKTNTYWSLANFGTGAYSELVLHTSCCVQTVWLIQDTPTPIRTPNAQRPNTVRGPIKLDYTFCFGVDFRFLDFFFI